MLKQIAPELVLYQWAFLNLSTFGFLEVEDVIVFAEYCRQQLMSFKAHYGFGKIKDPSANSDFFEPVFHQVPQQTRKAPTNAKLSG